MFISLPIANTRAGNRTSTDGTWTYTYDAAGNVTKKSKGASGDTWVYTYDNADQMLTAAYSATDGGAVTQRVTYAYDAWGNAIQRQGWDGTTATTTRYAQDGWDPVKADAIGNENFDTWADLDGSNAISMRRGFGPNFDELTYRQDAGGTVGWYLTDRLGSVRGITSGTGTPLTTISYDAWGKVLSNSTPAQGDAYQYTGQRVDPLTGLLGAGNGTREYDPSRGGWMQEDPWGLAVDVNPRRYVGNQPTGYTDPSGDSPITTADRITADGSSVQGVIAGTPGANGLPVSGGAAATLLNGTGALPSGSSPPPPYEVYVRPPYPLFQIPGAGSLTAADLEAWLQEQINESLGLGSGPMHISPLPSDGPFVTGPPLTYQALGMEEFYGTRPPPGYAGEPDPMTIPPKFEFHPEWYGLVPPKNPWDYLWEHLGGADAWHWLNGGSGVPNPFVPPRTVPDRMDSHAVDAWAAGQGPKPGSTVPGSGGELSRLDVALWALNFAPWGRLFRFGGKAGGKFRITQPGEVVNLGKGDALQHFTNLEGAAGITGVPEDVLAGLKPGQQVVVDAAHFKPGNNPFLTGEGGGVGVTKLGSDALPGQLEGIGVFGAKQQYVIEFSQETVVTNGIHLRPDMPSRSIWSLPGDVKLKGTITIKKLR